LRDKLTSRHPHIFGDTEVRDAADVADRWETLKVKEKGRTSVTDGIPMQLPALALYAKLLAKANLFGAYDINPNEARDAAIAAIGQLEFSLDDASANSSSDDVASAWANALVSLLEAARFAGVDLEGVLRARALLLRDEIRSIETTTE
jgi:XTP/dITP diphosphohydrolase